MKMYIETCLRWFLHCDMVSTQ